MSNENITFEDISNQIDERFPIRYSNPVRSLANKRWDQLLAYGFAIAFFAYHIWFAYTLGIPRAKHGMIHLWFIFTFWTFLQIRNLDITDLHNKILATGYGAYAIITTVPLYYIYTNYNALTLYRSGIYTNTDLLMGSILIVSLLIAVWTTSRLIFAVASLGLLYSYFGDYLPGIFHHGGLSIERVISMNTVEMQGILGNLTQISATWIVIFIILAGLIEMYGGMRLFIKKITRFVSRYHYLEIGYVAVLSSMIFGSINGAVTANSATTGAFTIPMMKENRYPPRFAAAIEAVASTGGQILPPVMGSSAFLMAQLINPSYSTIVISSIVPALIIYFTIIVGIMAYTDKHNVQNMNLDIASTDTSLRDRLISIAGYYDYIISIAVLLYWLLYIRASPMKAGFYGIIVLMILRLVRMLQTGYSNQDVLGESAQYVRQSLEGFLSGAETMVNITIMVASLGIIVRAFVVTGFAQNLSAFLISLSGGNPIVLVLLAAVASIIFGMGMPTLAAYLLVALFVAPSLSSVFDISLLSIHMFVFYYAIVSNITPPIAIAVVITKGIADADFIHAAIDSMKLGISMFVLPFVFIFQPEILHIENGYITAIATFIGLIAMTVGVVGFRADSLPIRFIAIVIGGFIIFGSIPLQVGALLVGATGIAYTYRERRTTPA